MKIYLYYESNFKKDYTWLEVPDENEFSVMIERDYRQRLDKAKPGETVKRRTPQEILNERSANLPIGIFIGKTGTLLAWRRLTPMTNCWALITRKFVVTAGINPMTKQRIR